MRLPLQKRLDTYTFIFLSARASAHIARFTKIFSIVPKRPDFVRLSCALSTSYAARSTYRPKQYISEEVRQPPLRLRRWHFCSKVFISDSTSRLFKAVP